MKNFLRVLFALVLALLASDAYAGCQQQVLALRQVQAYHAPIQLKLRNVYGVPQQLNDGCYSQEQVQLEAVRIQQQRHHDNQPQFIIVKQERQRPQVIIQREAVFPRLRAR